MSKKVVLGLILGLSLILNSTEVFAAETSTSNNIMPISLDSSTAVETEMEEGLSGEAEVVCADPTEPGCAPDDPDYINEDDAHLIAHGFSWVLTRLLTVAGVLLGVGLVGMMVYFLVKRGKHS